MISAMKPGLLFPVLGTRVPSVVPRPVPALSQQSVSKPRVLAVLVVDLRVSGLRGRTIEIVQPRFANLAQESEAYTIVPYLLPSILGLPRAEHLTTSAVLIRKMMRNSLRPIHLVSIVLTAICTAILVTEEAPVTGASTMAIVLMVRLPLDMRTCVLKMIQTILRLLRIG